MDRWVWQDDFPHGFQRITVEEIRSAQRAEIMLRGVVDLPLSDNTTLWIVGDVGREPAERRDSPIPPNNYARNQKLTCAGVGTYEIGGNADAHSLPKRRRYAA